MHIWPNPSITKNQISMPAFRSKRPKGLTDEAWKAMVAESLLNKQIMLNNVPKLSQKGFVKKDK
jgi:hypothetical protein